MKLALIILCDEDQEEVTKYLVQAGYTPTLLASTGELFEYGKSLLLLGLELEQIGEVKALLDQHTHRYVIKNKEKLKADIYIVDSDKVDMHKS